MNTYVQDVKTPIYITLSYEKKIMKFPINPPDWKETTGSDSVSADIEDVGEVAIPQQPKLTTITISSFFWHEVNILPSSLYVMWLKKWQKSKIPARLVVTGLNRAMLVTCQSFEHWVNAGEEKDVYFTLQLKEYRPYGARPLSQVANKTLLEKLKKLKELVTTPVLFEIPRPHRSTTLKRVINDPYKVMAGETLISITKKITGTSAQWKKLYKANADKLDSTMEGDGAIPAGTLLKLPSGWATNVKNQNDISET